MCGDNDQLTLYYSRLFHKYPPPIQCSKKRFFSVTLTHFSLIYLIILEVPSITDASAHRYAAEIKMTRNKNFC